MFYNSEAIPKLWTNQKLSHGIAITWRVLVISGLSNEGLDWKKSADVMTSLSKGPCCREMTVQMIISCKCQSYNIRPVISFPKWGLPFLYLKNWQSYWQKHLFFNFSNFVTLLFFVFQFGKWWMQIGPTKGCLKSTHTMEMARTMVIAKSSTRVTTRATSTVTVTTAA